VQDAIEAVFWAEKARESLTVATSAVARAVLKLAP